MNEQELKSGDPAFVPENVVGVMFSIGGYFDGNSFVSIVREGSSGALCACHSYQGISCIRKFSAREWNSLMDMLFNRLSVQEWKQEYCDNCVLDGIQWELVFGLKQGGGYKIYGSNEYPPDFDKLKRRFRRYSASKAMEELGPSDILRFTYLFRNDPVITGFISRYRQSAEAEASFMKRKDSQE